MVDINSKEQAMPRKAAKSKNYESALQGDRLLFLIETPKKKKEVKHYEKSKKSSTA